MRKSHVMNLVYIYANLYSLRPTLFVLFEKSNFLREHHLLFCLPFKDIQVSKTTLK